MALSRCGFVDRLLNVVLSDSSGSCRENEVGSLAESQKFLPSLSLPIFSHFSTPNSLRFFATTQEIPAIRTPSLPPRGPTVPEHVFPPIKHPVRRPPWFPNPFEDSVVKDPFDVSDVSTLSKAIGVIGGIVFIALSIKNRELVGKISREVRGLMAARSFASALV